MNMGWQAVILAMALVLAPAAASAAEAPPVKDELTRSQAFPSLVHWAMIAAGAAFVGAAFFIQRRRGFDVD